MNDSNVITSLQDRLAALHHASLELVQDFSINTLMDRLARIAAEQAQARFAAIGINNAEGRIEEFITVGISAEERARIATLPSGEGLLGLLTHAQKPIRVPNLNNDPRCKGFPLHHPAMQSFLGVPIRIGNQNIGQIYLANKLNADEFSLEDEQVVETLAAYAAVAISNARSYNALRERDRALTRRNKDLALLNDLASMLASVPEMETMLETALAEVMRYFNVDIGEIFLCEDDQRTLNIVVHQGDLMSHIWRRASLMLLGESLVGYTAQTAQAQVVNLPYKDDPYLERGLHRAGIAQVGCFPLASRNGVLGVLCIATCQKEAFEAAEIKLLTSIASWVGTTLENMRLNIQGRRLAILEERERIGMDLHDGVIQSIYAVGLTLEHARLLMEEDTEQARKRIDQSIDDLNTTIRDIRAFIMDLRPRQLHEESLMNGIQRLVNEFRANTLMDVPLTGPTSDLMDLNDSCAVALFHICQEALANVAKHAHAKHVEVLLWTTPERVLLEVHDDGLGFDMQKMHLTLGHGLSNMQTRARNVGGDVEITADAGDGTTILAWVPYTREILQAKGQP